VYKEVTRCLRMGDSLFVVTPNVLRYETLGVQSYEGRVVGPTLAARFQAIARLSRTSSTLHISGESGVGKELAARAFHASGASPSGPFVAVNCAAIPEGVAERLLFGARRGAFSGAIADSEGYIQAADGGTLFLDEVAELDPLVQGKLLRVLETKEVLALGASRPRTVDVRICSATCRDLRNEVAKGRLREDLYYRLGRPEVVIPPLYDRPEEIPWLIGSELARSGAGVVPHASVVEACLLRRWPGNIRELLTELRVAIEETQAAGSGRLEGKHLSPTAGVVLSPQRAMVPPAAPSDGRSSLTKAALREILRREKGNVSSAARALGVHRNQMRRWLVRHQIDPIEFTAPASRRRQRQDR
jgi:transcriptional regulator with PAS, ATPase and Fis domain